MIKYIPLSLVLICCFIFGGIMFKSVTPPRCESLMQNDTIFVLTGDERRIPYALKKLDDLQYGKLYIIGAGVNKISNHEHVSIETESKSTYQNALAIKNIVEQNNLTRIVIITTEDHMNRSLYLLHDVLPETDVIPCPASLTGMPTPVRVKRWGLEYIKYIVTLFGIKES